MTFRHCLQFHVDPGKWTMRIFGRHLSVDLSRWTATRAAARLGIIAGTIFGFALAFHVGGRDGYTVPMGILLGAPTNVFILQFMPHFQLTSAGPASEWSLNQLAFCIAMALNWTFIGFVVDLVRGPAPKPETPSTIGCKDDLDALGSGDEDALTKAFEALERAEKARRQDEKNSSARRVA